MTNKTSKTKAFFICSFFYRFACSFFSYFLFFLHHVQKFKDFVLQSVSNSKRSEQFVKGSIYKAKTSLGPCVAVYVQSHPFFTSSSGAVYCSNDGVKQSCSNGGGARCANSRQRKHCCYLSTCYLQKKPTNWMNPQEHIFCLYRPSSPWRNF